MLLKTNAESSVVRQIQGDILVRQLKALGKRGGVYYHRITYIRNDVLTFRHGASCILGQAFRYSPENAFYTFNQQIYFII